MHAKKSSEYRHIADATDEAGAEHDTWTDHLRRKEQDTVYHIIHGADTGNYHLIFGCKVWPLLFVFALLTIYHVLQGTGKTTMILDAMQANQAEGVAMCDAHPDLEVFRLRLGKALNYEYNEDSQTGLFSRRDPREGEFLLLLHCQSLSYWSMTKVALGSMSSEVCTLVLLTGLTNVIVDVISHEQTRESGASICTEDREAACPGPQ